MRLVLLALLLAPAPALAQMYKCVDANGVTSYADQPCVGAKGGPVEIHGSPPISGALQPRSEDLNSQEAEFRRRQIAREREAEQDRAAAQKRCATLRQEYGRLAAPVRRIVEVDAHGDRTYMDDQAREKRTAELRDQLRSCP